MATAAAVKEQDQPATRFAKDHLKAFVERIERLEEEKKTIADDVRDGVSRSMQRRDSVLGRGNLHAGSIQEVRMNLSEVRNVVDDEDPVRLGPPSVRRDDEKAGAFWPFKASPAWQPAPLRSSGPDLPCSPSFCSSRSVSSTPSSRAATSNSAAARSVALRTTSRGVHAQIIVSSGSPAQSRSLPFRPS